MLISGLLHLSVFTVACLFPDYFGLPLASSLLSPQRGKGEHNITEMYVSFGDTAREDDPAETHLDGLREALHRQPDDESFGQAAEEPIEETRETSPETPPDQPRRAPRYRNEAGDETAGGTQAESRSENRAGGGVVNSDIGPFLMRGLSGTGEGSAETLSFAQISAEVEKEEFTSFLQEILSEHRRYPLAARKREIEGQVSLKVYVSRKGALERAEISLSSGSGILDRAAEDLVKRIFPVGYPLESGLSTTIRITYRLTDV